MPTTAAIDANGPARIGARNALIADATLTGLVPATRIAARILQAPGYPFVRLETPFAQRGPTETFGKHGTEVTLWVHVFTTYDAHRGDDAADDIVTRVLALLHYQTLTVTGWTFTSCIWAGTRDVSSEEVAGVPIVHKVVEFSVLVRES